MIATDLVNLMLTLITCKLLLSLIIDLNNKFGKIIK